MGGVDVRGVAAYLALVYGLTAAAVALMVLVGGVRGPGAVGVYAVMMLPALSAFLSCRYVSGEGFARRVLRLGPKRYYLVAYLLPLLLVSASYGLVVLFGLGRPCLSEEELVEHLERLTRALGGATVPRPPPDLGYLEWLAALSAANLTAFVLVGMVFCLGEELGWRAYLLPKLLPLGRWRALALTGLLWWLWHQLLLPVAPRTWGSPAELAAMLATGLAGAVAVSTVFAWLLYASQSVLPAALAHAVFNQAGQTLALLVDFNPAAFNAVLAAVLWAVVLALHKLGELGKIEAQESSSARSPRGAQLRGSGWGWR